MSEQLKKIKGPLGTAEAGVLRQRPAPRLIESETSEAEETLPTAKPRRVGQLSTYIEESRVKRLERAVFEYYEMFGEKANQQDFIKDLIDNYLGPDLFRKTQQRKQRERRK
jgi:hypothetical protein